jgi:hypothetical protein
MVSNRPSSATRRLAARLRGLREEAPVQLTQGDLGRVLGGTDPLSPAAISMWENPASGRIPPQSRLEAYARLFCTPRTFEGEVRMLQLSELTSEERDHFDALKKELLGLRTSAVSGEVEQEIEQRRSLWHFPDRSRITLVSSRVPEDMRPPYANRNHIDYVRAAGLLDLDAVIDIYGAIKAYNPTSMVVITYAEELNQRDVSNHMVLIGGRAWTIATRWFFRIFPIPIEGRDPGESGSIVVNPRDKDKQEFKYVLDGDELLEDVGVFARGPNPSAPRRTLTICTGITSRGVLGAAQSFIDPEMRESNEQYVLSTFPENSTYCIVMKVPVVNAVPLTPDLSRAENRLFVWSDADARPM